MEARNQYDADDEREREWEDRSGAKSAPNKVKGDKPRPEGLSCAPPALSNAPSLVRFRPSEQEHTLGAIPARVQSDFAINTRAEAQLQVKESARQRAPQRRKASAPRAARPRAQPPQGDWFGVTPLHIAVERRSLPLVKLLVRSGADVDAQDSTGRSPLHLACEMERMDLVQALLGVKLQNRASTHSPSKAMQRLKLCRAMDYPFLKFRRPKLMLRRKVSQPVSVSSSVSTSETSGSATTTTIG